MVYVDIATHNAKVIPSNKLISSTQETTLKCLLYTLKLSAWRKFSWDLGIYVQYFDGFLVSNTVKNP